MECFLCKTKEKIKILKGGFCNSCGRFFCGDCYSIIEEEKTNILICKICKIPKKEKFTLSIFFAPLLSFIIFFIIYFSIRDYLGKYLLIFFLIPIFSFFMLYLNYKKIYPFNPSFLFYILSYLLSLIPWLFGFLMLLKFYF